VVLGGVIILGAAFAYGIVRWRGRDRRLDPLRKQATRENYRAENRFE
jgi:hypothetical protein